MQGPLYGSCPPGHWHPETCPESCADKTKYGCSVCLTDPHCGWCNQDNTCRDGNMEAPVDEIELTGGKLLFEWGENLKQNDAPTYKSYEE